MAFLDNISRIATEASQKAVQKTKDFSDVSRLHAAISEKEREMRALYEKIGRLYMTLHREDPEPSFAAPVEKILELEKMIDAYHKEIGRIKGARRCPACGAEVAYEAAFCSACGAPMPKLETEAPQTTADEAGEMAKKLCAHCGAQVDQDALFCTECGAKFAQVQEEF